MEFSTLYIAMSIGAGLASVLSPCVLPVVPVIVAGSDRRDRLRPLLLVAGLSFTFIIMGIVSSVFGYLLVGRMRYIEQAGGVVILLLGMLVLFDVNVFKRMYWLSNIRVTTGGRIEGLLMGMALGVIWVPCIGPMLSSILAMVGTSGELAKGVVFLTFYSMGFSIPMLAVGYSSHFVQSRIRFLYGKEKLLRYITGGILSAFGLYIIVSGNLAY